MVTLSIIFLVVTLTVFIFKLLVHKSVDLGIILVIMYILLVIYTIE